MDDAQINEIDKQLKQLAIAAQQQPPKTPKRKKALTKLLNAIEQSGLLCRPRRDEFLSVYKEIYTEARQDLMLCICREIDKYNPEKEVMQWVNFIMRNRCFPEAIPKVIGKDNQRTFSLSELDNILDNFAEPEDEDSLCETIVNLIKEDPGDEFKNEKIKKYPHVNFQTLLLKRISETSWKEISAEFGVEIPTLSSFYQRSLNKFNPKFREYL